MRNKRPLTIKAYVSIGDADPVPIESLPKEQLEMIREGWAKRIGKTLSAYYSEHPEKYPEFVELARQAE